VIDFRRQHPVLAKGEQSDMTVQGDVVSFTRTHGGEQMVFAFNISHNTVKAELPAGSWQAKDYDLGTCTSINGNTVELAAHQAVIAIQS